MLLFSHPETRCFLRTTVMRKEMVVLANELIECLVKCGSMVSGEPKLRVVGEAHAGLMIIEIAVEFDIMGLVPFLQCSVYLF